MSSIVDSAPRRAAAPPVTAPSMPRAVWLAAAAIAVLLGLGALGGGFHMDDWFLLGRTSLPWSWEAMRFRLATEEHRIVLWVHARPLEIEYFRPLVMLSLWLERRLWGLDPRGYHATNVLLHAVAAWLVFRLFLRLGLRSGPAAGAAIAWGLGLGATTPLAWVAARTESLCALFSFGGALAFLSWRDRAGRGALGIAVACAALAVTAKETGIVAPLLWMLAARLAPREPAAAPRREIGPAVVALLLAPGLAMLALRQLVLRLPLPPPAYLEPLASSQDLVRLALRVPLQLLCWLLSVPVSHLGPLDALLARPPATLAALVALGALLVVLGRAAGWPAVRFATAWSVVALLPALPVVPTSLYAYQPLAGIAWLLGSAWQRTAHRGFAVWLGAWVVFGAIGTLATYEFQRRTVGPLEHAVERLVAEARAGRMERALLVDAPVWTYGIAPQIGLRHPDLRLETWFVDFAPDLAGNRVSRVEWSDSCELVLHSPADGYFRSPIERFLSFGGTPDRALQRENASVDVRGLEPGPHPRALAIRWSDRSALLTSPVFRFRAGELEPIAVPLNARAHERPLPPSPASPRARSPGAR